MNRPNPANVVDRIPTVAEWDGLTRSPRKREALTEDLYFRECWSDLTDLAGESAVEALGPVALLMFKPDGIVGRRARRTLDYLAEHGFVPVGTLPVALNRHSMRELWRYNWDVYPSDRLALSTVLYSAADTLALLLRDTRARGVPGSVRLADLKGAGDDPAKRRPDQLRTVLRTPNKIINFVHVSDEPVDVLREVGIFADRTERRALLSTVLENQRTGREHDVLGPLAELEERLGEHDFDTANSLERLLSSGVCRDGDRLRKAVAGGGTLRWHELIAILPPADPSVNVWDFVCVAAEVLPREQAGSRDLLPGAGLTEWSRRAGS